MRRSRISVRSLLGVLSVVAFLSCSFDNPGAGSGNSGARVSIVLPVQSGKTGSGRLLLPDASRIDVSLQQAGVVVAEQSASLAAGAGSVSLSFTVDPGESYGISASAWNADGTTLLYTGSGSFVAAGSSSATVYLIPYTAGTWPAVTEAGNSLSVDLPVGGRATLSLSLGGRSGCVLPELSGVEYYAQNPDGSPVAVTTLGNGRSCVFSASVADPAAPVLLTLYNASGPARSGWEIAFQYAVSITIVYDSASPNDTAYAEGLRDILEEDISALSGASGTDALWSVELLPQTDIPTVLNVDYTGFADSGFIVLSAYSSLGVYPASGASADQLGRLRNVLLFEGRLVAMGGAVTAFDVIAANYAAWGVSGIMPTGLGWGLSATTSGATQLTVTSHSAWSSPFSLSSMPASGSAVTVSGAATYVSVYCFGGTPPTDGQILGQDTIGGIDYYPVVSQGYFLQYGIPVLPTTDAGKVFLRNAFAWLRDLSI